MQRCNSVCTISVKMGIIFSFYPDREKYWRDNAQITFTDFTPLCFVHFTHCIQVNQLPHFFFGDYVQASGYSNNVIICQQNQNFSVHRSYHQEYWISFTNKIFQTCFVGCKTDQHTFLFHIVVADSLKQIIADLHQAQYSRGLLKP